MAHQFLLYSYSSAAFVEPGTVAVAKSVPANYAADPCCNSRLGNVLPLNLPLVVRPASLGIGEQPSLRCGAAAVPVLKKGICQQGVEWHLISGVLRLHVTNVPVNDTTLHEQCASLEVKVPRSPFHAEPEHCVAGQPPAEGRTEVGRGGKCPDSTEVMGLF